MEVVTAIAFLSLAHACDVLGLGLRTSDIHSQYVVDSLFEDPVRGIPDVEVRVWCATVSPHLLLRRLFNQKVVADPMAALLAAYTAPANQRLKFTAVWEVKNKSYLLEANSLTKEVIVSVFGKHDVVERGQLLVLVPQDQATKFESTVPIILEKQRLAKLIPLLASPLKH